MKGYNILWVLKWMDEQFCRRIDSPLDRELIWLWPDSYHYLYEKEALDFGRYAFFTFEIPANYYKKAILWSDFYRWHLVLNRLWENEPDESDRYERIFQLKRNEKPGTIQGITTRLHKDWVKKIT